MSEKNKRLVARKKNEPICLWIDRLTKVVPTLCEDDVRKVLVDLSKESLFEGVSIERKRLG